MKKIILAVASLFIVAALFSQKPLSSGTTGIHERAYLVKTLMKIANPVLEALSKNELKKRMPVESSGRDREKYTHLEAFGRLISGMAPWLELGSDHTPEGILRKKYIDLVQTCLHNATDPASPDYMNFSSEGQPVVDAAFLAQGLLRAPAQLWEPLDKLTKANIIAALKKCDGISHAQNNWIMFSATIEAALLKFSGSFNRDATTGYIQRFRVKIINSTYK